VKEETKYSRVWYDSDQSWEYYKSTPYGCYYWNLRYKEWIPCGTSTRDIVEVSQLEILVLFGREAVRE